MKKEILLPIKEKSSRWWIGSNKHKITWYTKKGDDIYLIPGSEFPEKKLDPKTKTFKEVHSNWADVRLMFFIALGAFIGVGLAALIISFMI